MIRKHLPSDLDVVMDIWFRAQSLAHPFLQKSFVEMVTKAMREMYIPGSETWVYEDRGEVVGFIGMQAIEIGGLFVHPDHHSKGIGSQLVNFILEKQKELEVEVFVKNTIGRSFYDKFGFKTYEESLHEPTGEMVLRMKFSS